MSDKKSTLEIIQVFAKIGKVLSKIVNVLCFVGAILCLVGILCLILLPEALDLGGITIHGLIEISDEVNLGTGLAGATVGLILCLGEILVSKKAVSYFQNELEDGTPFTFNGAAELLEVGKYAIVVPVVTAIAAGIAHGIFSALFENVQPFHYEGIGTFGLGITFVVLSFLCKYGAELEGARHV